MKFSSIYVTRTLFVVLEYNILSQMCNNSLWSKIIAASIVTRRHSLYQDIEIKASGSNLSGLSVWNLQWATMLLIYHVNSEEVRWQIRARYELFVTSIKQMVVAWENWNCILSNCCFKCRRLLVQYFDKKDLREKERQQICIFHKYTFHDMWRQLSQSITPISECHPFIMQSCLEFYVTCNKAPGKGLVWYFNNHLSHRRG